MPFLFGDTFPEESQIRRHRRALEDCGLISGFILRRKISSLCILLRRRTESLRTDISQRQLPLDPTRLYPLLVPGRLGCRFSPDHIQAAALVLYNLNRGKREDTTWFWRSLNEALQGVHWRYSHIWEYHLPEFDPRFF